MMSKRRTFTKEFKLETTSLMLNQSYSAPEAARSLGFGGTALRRWVDFPDFTRQFVIQKNTLPSNLAGETMPVCE